MKKPDNTGLSEDEEKLELSISAGWESYIHCGKLMATPIKSEKCSCPKTSNSAFTCITRQNYHVH